MAEARPVLGFIGLGQMGSRMAHNLLQAGYTLHAFDTARSALDAAIAQGAQAATSVADLVARSQVIMTSLPSSETFVQVAEQELLPHLRAGQTVIDLGTTTPPETRRLAAAFAVRGVDLLDVPVSGFTTGIEEHRLHMFVGGPEVTAMHCRPILEAIGGDCCITYCGPVGSGQVVKGVNQLMMALANAAYLEAVSFGIRCGVDAATICRAIGDEGRWRRDFSEVARQVERGEANLVPIKFRELPYFLREARERQAPLPLTEVLFGFCDRGERVVVEDHRQAPSFWHELVARERP